MSTAGQIFNEKIFTISETAAGSKTFEIDVENDGCLIFIQQTAGSATITGSIDTDARDSTPSIQLDTINITGNIIASIIAAVIFRENHARLRECNWGFGINRKCL